MTCKSTVIDRINSLMSGEAAPESEEEKAWLGIVKNLKENQTKLLKIERGEMETLNSILYLIKDRLDERRDLIERIFLQ